MTYHARLLLLLVLITGALEGSRAERVFRPFTRMQLEAF